MKPPNSLNLLSRSTTVWEKVSGPVSSSNNIQGKIQQHVARSVVCWHCGTDFDSEDIYVLGQRDACWLVAISCPRCMRQGVLFLRHPVEDSSLREDAEASTLPGDVDASVEPARELTDEERARFERLPPIDDTDLHALRAALQELQNDITALWKP